MASILDVAKRAGVSKSTVSRVMNGGSVSTGSYKAVLRAIEEMGYHPNGSARDLARKVTKIIGVVVTDVTDSYYSEIIRGAENCASENGYDLLLCSSHQDEQREAAFLRKLLEKRVDGLLIVSCGSNKEQETLETYAIDISQQRPLVILERTVPGSVLHTVNIDNRGSSEMAVRHLINLGHTRIGHILGPMNTPWGQERHRGYERALALAGIPYDESFVVEGSFRYEGGYEGAKRLLRLPEPPTAVFAANDISALGVWKAAKEMGISIPGDLALVGFDDLELLSIAEIPLTTVRQPRMRMGYTAMNMLLSLFKSEAVHGEAVILPTELVIRDSCGHRRGLGPKAKIEI